MKKALKIAIYSGEIPSTTFIERFISGLAIKGHNIYLFGVKKQSTIYAKNVFNYGYLNTWLYKLFYLLKYWILLSFFKPRAKRELHDYLKEYGYYSLYSLVKAYPVLWHHPDVFHVQWAKGIDEWMWVKKFGIKLIVSLRGAHINYSPIANTSLAEMYRKNFPEVDGFHAVSMAIATEAQKYGADKSKIKVVYSGLNIKSINSSAPNISSNEFKILSVGRNHWVKGYNYALDACKILKESKLNFNYKIIGANKDIELLYQVKDLGIESEVMLLDTVPFQEVVNFICQADLLLLPSVKEGVPNVVLEAMELGTPVLTTDCGGVTEVIQNGVNGWICPIRDPVAMAKCILEIHKLSDKEKSILIDRAKTTIAKQHQLNNMVQGMESMYENIISS